MTRVYDALRRALDEGDEDSLLDVERASLSGIGISDAGGARVDLPVEAKPEPLPREEPRHSEELRQREQPRTVPVRRPRAPVPLPVIEEPAHVEPEAAPENDVAPDAAELLAPPAYAEPVDTGERKRSWMRLRTVQVVALMVVVAGVIAGAFSYFGNAGANAVRLAGVVEANEVVVSPKIGGRVTELTVNEGDRVERGAIVARLDTAELEADRKRQVAAIAELEAKLGQSREMVGIESDRTREETRRAEARLRAARNERDQAVAELEQAKKDAARAEALSSQDMLPRQEVERARSNVDIATARVGALTDQVNSADADLALAEGGARQVVVASGTVDSTRAELQQAQAQLAQIDTRLADTVLRAPLSGVVSLRVSRQGEVVEAGSPVLTVIDPHDTWVRASVEERAADAVRLDDGVDVELSSGARLRGRVTQVAAVAEFATRRDVSRGQRDVRSIGLKVALPPDARAHSGMTAYVILPRSR